MFCYDCSFRRASVPEDNLYARHKFHFYTFLPPTYSRVFDCTIDLIQNNPKATSHPAPMPLHTYHYACGCRRYIQGRECSCFLNELLSINNPVAFSASQANYLPFNMENSLPRSSHPRPHTSSNAYSFNSYGSCRRHDRRYRSRYDCPDHIYRRQKLLYENHWAAQRMREFEHRRKFGREWSGFGVRR